MNADQPATFAQWLLRSLAMLGDCNGQLNDL